MPVLRNAPHRGSTWRHVLCDYCTDDEGKLQPYEAILEGTISGYFMGMQNMKRAEAEVAAKEHLAKMPAWKCRE